MPKPIKEKIRKFDKANRLITENLVDAIWVVDAATLVYEYITPSVNKICGYTSEELIRTKVADRLTPESSKRMNEMLSKKLLKLGSGQKVYGALELEMLHKNGGTYWIEIRAKIVEEPHSPLKIVGITRDITTRKRNELELAKLNRQLTDVLAEKEKLLKEVRILRGLLPVCSGCRRIRDEDGKWWPLEEYVRSHTDSDFTHTMCSDCRDIYYPGMKK